ADADALFRWELLSHEAKKGPRTWYVDLAGDRPDRPPNYSLGALSTTRAVTPINREPLFRGEVLVFGHERFHRPHRLRLEVDGKPVRNLPPPSGAGEKFSGGLARVPFSFPLRFDKPGSHLVSVTVEADPPPDERPAGYVL